MPTVPLSLATVVCLHMVVTSVTDMAGSRSTDSPHGVRSTHSSSGSAPALRSHPDNTANREAPRRSEHRDGNQTVSVVVRYTLGHVLFRVVRSSHRLRPPWGDQQVPTQLVRTSGDERERTGTQRQTKIRVRVPSVVYCDTNTIRPCRLSILYTTTHRSCRGVQHLRDTAPPTRGELGGRPVGGESLLQLNSTPSIWNTTAGRTIRSHHRIY